MSLINFPNYEAQTNLLDMSHLHRVIAIVALFNAKIQLDDLHYLSIRLI